MAEPTVTPVHAFADRAWEQFLELNPLMATVQGDDRWDDRLDDPGPEGRAAGLAMVDGWEAEIDGFGGLELSVEDQVTLGVIRFVIGRLREGHELKLWHFEAMDALEGPQIFVADLARLQVADDPESLRKLLARLAAYPSWMAAHRANLAEGIAAGRTAAPAVVERCLTQTRRMVETPAAEHPIVLVHADLDEASRTTLTQAVEEHVLPALREWLEMLENYATHVRSGDGIGHLEDGEALYRHYIHAWTTIVEEPTAIHEYGLERLDVIARQELEIATGLGFEDVAALRTHLEAAPENHVTDPGELVVLAKELVERAEAEAPKWFGRLPREGCEVPVSYTHLTLPTMRLRCRSRWSPYH
mgnify:FL=1